MRQVAKCECVHWPNWMRPDSLDEIKAKYGSETLKTKDKKEIAS